MIDSGAITLGHSSSRETSATVLTIHDVASDVRAIDLVFPSDFEVEPGGHIDVQVSIGEQLRWRSYSVVSASGTSRTIRIAVKRLANSRGGSLHMWTLAVGDQIEVRFARNTFAVDYSGTEHVLLAGGIGVTPLIGIARALKSAGKHVSFHYCVNSLAQAAFVDEIRGFLGSALVLHAPGAGRRLSPHSFVAGLTPDTRLHMCGPLSLMAEVQRCWHERGLPQTGLRYETFGASCTSDAEPFEVRIAQGVGCISVPRDRTLLDALLDSGHDVMFDCRRGECGLCKVSVLKLDGRIDHRDVFFSEREKLEGKAMCSCVSRVVGSVEISIDRISHGRAC